MYLSSLCRKRLFNMINDLPTIFEAVTGSGRKQGKEKSVSNNSSTKSKSNSKVSKLEKQTNHYSLTLIVC